jgi:hypothetical protein
VPDNLSRLLLPSKPAVTGQQLHINAGELSLVINGDINTLNGVIADIGILLTKSNKTPFNSVTQRFSIGLFGDQII